MHDEVSRFTATFHTHLSAILTAKALERAGISAALAPVPRALSSSCGTCVFYCAQEPMVQCLDRDTEAVYRADAEGYHLIFTISD